MKAKGIVFVIFSLLGSLSAYSQVNKQELFDAVMAFEIDSLNMRTDYADKFHSLRSSLKYSIWWDDVFIIDKCNNGGAIEFFEYEMWSSLDCKGKVVELKGVTDETRNIKVKDLVSQWDIPKIVNLFKRDEGWRYHAEYDPMLYVVRVKVRGGKIVSINGLTLKGYLSRSKFARLKNDY